MQREFVDTISECTLCYHSLDPRDPQLGVLEIIPPSGLKVGLNIGRTIRAADDAVAFARRFSEIAREVTARGSTAKPSMAQLNELLALADKVLAKAEGRQ